MATENLSDHLLMQDLPSPYPLCWPEGIERVDAKKRRTSKFRVVFDTAVKELVAELKRFGYPFVVTSDMIGLVAAEPTDPAVAVWVKMASGLRCIPCDEYATMRDNVRAITLTVAALRAIDNHGIRMLENVMGRAQLTLPAGQRWREILESPSTLAMAESTYKRMVKACHPDNKETGNREAFDALEAAITEARRVLK